MLLLPNQALSLGNVAQCMIRPISRNDIINKVKIKIKVVGGGSTSYNKMRYEMS